MNASSALRVEAVSGYAQLINYKGTGTTCSGTIDVVLNFALSACIPVGVLDGVTDKSTKVTYSNPTVVVTGYSDTNCQISTNMVDFPGSGCQGGKTVNVFTTSTVPPTPLTVKYTQLT